MLHKTIYDKFDCTYHRTLCKIWTAKKQIQNNMSITEQNSNHNYNSTKQLLENQLQAQKQKYLR